MGEDYVRGALRCIGAAGHIDADIGLGESYGVVATVAAEDDGSSGIYLFAAGRGSRERSDIASCQPV